MAQKARKQPEAAKEDTRIVLKRQRGVVKSYDKEKGFGYIITGKQGQEKEFYVMKSGISSESRVLSEGEKVIFMIGLGIDGKNMNVAVDVTRNKECFTCGKEGHAYPECPNKKTLPDVPQRRSSPSVSPGADSSCYYCKEPGHIVRDCPKRQNQNNGGGSDGSCHYCKEPGHMARDCPKKRNQSNGICYNCREPGHMKRDCTKEKYRPLQLKPRNNAAVCYNCQQPGHIARDCQQPETSSRSNGNPGGSGQGVCYNCQEPGHMARYCDQPCRKCNQMGHMPKDCPSPKVGGGQNNDSGCYKCGEPGHFARECLNKTVKQSNGRS